MKCKNDMNNEKQGNFAVLSLNEAMNINGKDWKNSKKES